MILIISGFAMQIRKCIAPPLHPATSGGSVGSPPHPATCIPAVLHFPKIRELHEYENIINGLWFTYHPLHFQIYQIY